MNESELLHELSEKTGLPESAAEALLHATRDLIHAGRVDASIVLLPGDHARIPIAANPSDPRLVDEVIARARKHPLGLDFLVNGPLAGVAIALDAHAFTIEAARARLRGIA